MFTSENAPQKAEGLLRMGMGIFLLLAGLNKVMGTFALDGGDSFLPAMLVQMFGMILPFLEVAFGVWLLSGWKREMGLWAVGMLYVIFILGLASMKDMAGVQGVFLYLLVVAYTMTLPAGGCCCFKKMCGLKKK